MQMLPAATQPAVPILNIESLLPATRLPAAVPPAPTLPPRGVLAQFSVPPPPAGDAPDISRGEPCSGAVQPTVLKGQRNAPKLQKDNLYCSAARCGQPTGTMAEARYHGGGTLRDTKRSRARWADMLCSSDDEDTHVSLGWSVGSGSSQSSSDTTTLGSTLSGASAMDTPESTAALEQDDDRCYGSEQEDLDWQEEASLCEDVVTLPDTMTRSSEASDDAHGNELPDGDLEIIHAPVCDECEPLATAFLGSDARIPAHAPEAGLVSHVDVLDDDALRAGGVTVGARTARNQRKKARRVAAKKQCPVTSAPPKVPPVVRAPLKMKQHKTLNRRLSREVRAEMLQLVVEVAGRQMELLLGIGSFFLSQALRHPQLAACAVLYSSMAH